MSEERGPNWAGGVFAVGVFFIGVAVVRREAAWLLIAAPLIIFVSVAVARRHAGSDRRNDRPWRGRGEGRG